MNKNKQVFIGKTISITKTKNKEQENIQGIIIDETKNTFKIKTTKKIITILKLNKTFKINNEEINGNKINKKPEERIKLKG